MNRVHQTPADEVGSVLDTLPIEEGVPMGHKLWWASMLLISTPVGLVLLLDRGVRWAMAHANKRKEG